MKRTAFFQQDDGGGALAKLEELFSSSNLTMISDVLKWYVRNIIGDLLNTRKLSHTVLPCIGH